MKLILIIITLLFSFNTMAEERIWEWIQVLVLSPTSVLPAAHQSKNVGSPPDTTDHTDHSPDLLCCRLNHPGFRLDFRAQNSLSIVKTPTNNYISHPSSTHIHQHPMDIVFSSVVSIFFSLKTINLHHSH